MQDVAYETRPNIQNQSKDNPNQRFESISLKHGLTPGTEISLKKVSIDPNSHSEVAPGQVLKGKISGEIGIGKPIKLIDQGEFMGMTTPIEDIKEQDGVIRVLTRSKSIYELKTRDNPDQKEISQIIEVNLLDQPKSTQDFWKNHRELLVKTVKIDNKIWSFTSDFDGLVMALVNSDEQPEIFHPRFFRKSHSDHQFKAVPGFRHDGAYLKGQENDQHHHYVQSGKLNHNVTLILETLPQNNSDQNYDILSEYMPVMPDIKQNIPGKNLEDLMFSENQAEIKNEDWEKIQTTLRYYLQVYEFLNHHTEKKSGQDIYNLLVKNSKYFGIDTQKMVDAMKAIPNKNNKWTMADIYSSQDPALINFKDELTEVAYKSVESLFQNPQIDSIMTTSGFVPNFDKPTLTYTKSDQRGSQIQIEAFTVTSPQGDVLCWEMAQDKFGRIYVDNIYDPNVGIDSYGTPKKKTNFGMLIYKPEDYPSQVTFVPNKYKKSIQNSRYIDISALTELSLPVRMYQKTITSSKHKTS